MQVHSSIKRRRVKSSTSGLCLDEGLRNPIVSEPVTRSPAPPRSSSVVDPSTLPCTRLNSTRVDLPRTHLIWTGCGSSSVRRLQKDLRSGHSEDTQCRQLSPKAGTPPRTREMIILKCRVLASLEPFLFVQLFVAGYVLRGWVLAAPPGNQQVLCIY